MIIRPSVLVIREISARLNMIVSFGLYRLLIWLLFCLCRL
jgi:hypothetical protein